MATWSSNGGQPAPQRALVSMAGAKEDHTFASYIQQWKDPRCREPVVLHPRLLRPVFCWHCQTWTKGLKLKRSAEHSAAVSLLHVEQVPEPVDDLALEVRSCINCAQEICDKTWHLRRAAPAGRGGDTPLHQAAVSGNLAIFCHLITLVGEQEDGHRLAVEALRKTNDREETALHVALRMGNRDMVELMLWVDPQLANIVCHDISPIYLAVSLGLKDVTEALHHHASRYCSEVSYSGPNKQNALHIAVRRGEEMTKNLLAWNKDLITMQDKNGSTPLHFAVSVKQHPCFRLACFGFKFYSYTWLKRVPTWHLLDTDSSMAYRGDNEGLLPVHIAAMTNQDMAIRILLRRCPGCMGLRDKQGRTFLHVAVQNNASRVVREACDSKKCAPIMNIQDNNGNTALHLAVDLQNLWVVMALLRSQDVRLNLMNTKGQTTLDLARSKIRKGYFYTWNPDRVIYRTLVTLGPKYGTNYQWDGLWKNRIIPQLKPAKADDDTDDKQEADKLEKEESDKLEKEESDKLTSSTQTLGLGSVLIATVTFGATFAVPGGNIADDHPNGGSPTLAGSGRWYFDAFMVANTLAFVCSSLATVSLMYSGIAAIRLSVRRVHFNISAFFAWSSVTSLTAAYALGVYMVLAPVARSTAIAICAISPLLLLYMISQRLWELALVSGPLRRRRGLWVWLRLTVSAVFGTLIYQLWPFAVIFGWAGHLRKHHHG